MGVWFGAVSLPLGLSAVQSLNSNNEFKNVSIFFFKRVRAGVHDLKMLGEATRDWSQAQSIVSKIMVEKVEDHCYGIAEFSTERLWQDLKRAVESIHPRNVNKLSQLCRRQWLKMKFLPLCKLHKQLQENRSSHKWLNLKVHSIFQGVLRLLNMFDIFVYNNCNIWQTNTEQTLNSQNRLLQRLKTESKGELELQ